MIHIDLFDTVLNSVNKTLVENDHIDIATGIL